MFPIIVHCNDCQDQRYMMLDTCANVFSLTSYHPIEIPALMWKSRCLRCLCFNFQQLSPYYHTIDPCKKRIKSLNRLNYRWSTLMENYNPLKCFNFLSTMDARYRISAIHLSTPLAILKNLRKTTPEVTEKSAIF